VNATRTREIPAAEAQLSSERTEKSARASSESSVLWRIVALIVLLTAADLWASHHLGWGVRNPGQVAVLLAVLGGIAKLVGRAFPGEVKQVGARITERVRALVSDRVLAVCGVTFLLAASTFSSVIVLPESATDAQRVSLIGLDEADAVPMERSATRGELIRFRLRTSPFGRPVRLEAPGYVPTVFTVYPVVGLNVRLGQDLAPSPSVLFRPGVEGLSALGDSAVFRVRRVSENDTTLVAIGMGAHSFLLGRQRAITSELIADWERELQAMGAPLASLADMIGKWKRPKPLLASTALKPDDHLIAEILMGEVVVSSAEVTLWPDRLIDVPLTDGGNQ
jgi:hypothetical protein